MRKATDTFHELSSQAAEIKRLICASQNGDHNALSELCLRYEPLFLTEAKREIFSHHLGEEESLRIARQVFAELVLTYHETAYPFFSEYARCRIQYCLFQVLRERCKDWMYDFD